VTRFAELLAALVRSDVKFILIGGVAAAAHGSARNTQDIDIVYERSTANLERIVAALEPYNPYLRDAPPRLPFRLDVGTLRAGLNFTLTTDVGWLDLFAEIPGGGTYSELLDSSIEVELFGFRCRILDLDGLIRAKRATGRPKDLETIAELESIRGVPKGR
jgi:predicted nucleotidyltransferase